MLYGNIIFIKKTGGDGSKFPVTEKDIKIGRSEDCLIRIYNPQVAQEHCQLIIEENGQATLRNLSNQTILNGKPLGHKDVVLCHGDIFKIGERLARWEYLPTSKYYRQLLSPTGRLVAVVMPQQRPLGEEETPRASVSQGSVSKNTPLGKRRYSERAAGESSSMVKMRKSSGSELIRKSRSDLSKFLTGRHSLKTTKLIFQGGKPKERKSISGMISSKTPKGKAVGKTRKSTLPLWKVNIASPPGKISPAGRKSLKKSHRESVKSPKSVVKTPSKDTEELKSPETFLSIPKNKTKTPQRALLDSKSSEEVRSLASKSVLKTPLKTALKSPSNSGRKTSPRNTLSKPPSKLILSTPKPKSPKFAKLVYSESKISSISEKPSPLLKGRKRMTLMLEKVDFIPSKSAKEKTSEVSDKIFQTSVKDNSTNEASTVRKISPRKSLINTPVQKISRKSKELKRKSSEKKTSKSSQKMQKLQTPVKNPIITSPVIEKQSRTSRSRMSKKLDLLTSQEEIPLIILDDSTTPKESSRRTTSAKSTSRKKTPAKSVKKTQSPSPSHKISLSQNEIISPSLSPSVDKTPALNPVRSSQRAPKLSMKKIETLEATKGESASPTKGKITSPRGIQRKLSPSSSAERAAKKLKTSSPKKPDKNKKAALLVLGKANRKQLISQNVKVLLKQKIVKKALKQSNGVASRKDETRKKIATKLKKGIQKKTKSKKNPKKSNKLNNSNVKGASPTKTSKASDASIISFSAKSVTQEDTPKSKSVLEVSQMSPSKTLPTPRFSSKSKSTEATPKSSSKLTKGESISPTISFEKNAESYLFNSLRRCSKRLSSKNDTGRPDFIELSPTALGLMPKNLELFKTPKDLKRRSSSLVTPKNVRTTGIIKSASTSKIVNRKSVRFSPKNVSYNSEFSSPNLSEKTEFEFSSFQTPNITMDVFVSPLSEKNSVTKKDMNESQVLFVEEEISKSFNKNSRTNSEPKLCVRKLIQSPQSKKNLSISFNEKIVPRSSKTSLTNINSPVKVLSENKNSDLSDFEGVQQLFETPKTQKSPKKNLSDAKGVSTILRSAKMMKSPSELDDSREAKEYLQTPKTRKSPKNDLTDVRGVKRLLQTPKVQKSPKNDLTDVKGVKKLLQTPKVQKSPKNDLTDVKGVKRLLQTPRAQKSPKNDLTDIRGVKRLLQTPKMQKSPKNDLTDVRGVKKLLQTPKLQKSPKNDLTDVRGVKKLLRTPTIQKSPKNDLTDVRGVKKLLRTPKMQKSPRNDLSDLRGVKRLLEPPKAQKSPKNSLLDVSGVKNLFESPFTHNLTEIPNAEESLSETLISAAEVNQLLISKSSENVKNKKTTPRKSRVNDFRAIRGRRSICPTPKGPKNDLSDVMGVRELFLRHQPTGDYSINLTGVAELFDLPDPDVDSKQKRGKSVRKSILTVSETKSLRRRKALESQDENEESTKVTTRGTRLKKAPTKETEKKTPRNLKSKATDLKESKTTKRKSVEKVKTSATKKVSVEVKKTQKVTKTAKKPGGKTKMTVTFSESDNAEVRNSRKRKASEAPEFSLPKLRRNLRGAGSSTETKETPKKSLSRSKSKSDSREKISVKRVKKASEKAEDKKREIISKVQIKKAIKTTGTKQSPKVQSKRSQSKSKNISLSEEKVSPRKTRSIKTKTTTKKVPSKKTVGMKKPSPVVKRSTRRKVE